MLQLTKRTEYGLIALVHLVEEGARQANGRAPRWVSAREIGDAYHVPRRLLAEVLKDLGRAGLLESQRGPNGGYALAKDPALVPVSAAVAALEGQPGGGRCEPVGHADDGCDMVATCPIKTPIQRLRAGIWGLLQRTTLRDLATPAPHNPLGELIGEATALSIR